MHSCMHAPHVMVIVLLKQKGRVNCSAVSVKYLTFSGRGVTKIQRWRPDEDFMLKYEDNSLRRRRPVIVGAQLWVRPY